MSAYELTDEPDDTYWTQDAMNDRYEYAEHLQHVEWETLDRLRDHAGLGERAA